MREYKEKKVKGWVTDGKNMRMAAIDVRSTKDDRGESLSLSIEQDGFLIQLGIPMESVRDIIRLTNKGENK